MFSEVLEHNCSNSIRVLGILYHTGYRLAANFKLLFVVWWKFTNFPQNNSSSFAGFVGVFNELPI